MTGSKFSLKYWSSGFRICALAAAIPFLAPGAAKGLVPFLDGGIFIDVAGGVAYDTNIFSNESEVTDAYFTLVPTLQYRRAAGVLNLEFDLGVELLHFVDQQDENALNPFTSLTLLYPNREGRDPRQVRFNFRWRQDSGARQLIGERLDSETLNVSLTGRNRVSDRLALRGDISFENEQFGGGVYSEIEILTLSFEGIHVYSDNLETFLGYRYRHTQTAGVARRALNIHDHLLQGGAEGQLASRTVGRVSVGVQNRLFGEDDIADVIRPYGSVSVTWTPRARTAFTVLALKDFSVTPNDRSVDGTEFRVTLNQGVYRGFSLEPTLAVINRRVDRRDEETRVDDRYEAGIGFLYALASGATTALRYSYQNQDSNESHFTYERHVIDFSARITF